VFYRDEPRERDPSSVPLCDSNSQADDGLLGPLLGELIGPDLGSKPDGTEVFSPRAPLDSSTSFAATVPYDTSDTNAQGDSPVKPEPLELNDHLCVSSAEGTSQGTDEPIGFQGVFFRHVPSELLLDQTVTLYFGPQYFLWRASHEVCHAERPICLVQGFCTSY